MKKAYIFLCFLIPSVVQAQSWYSISDAQIHKSEYFVSNFTSYKWNDRVGVFLYVSKDKEYTDLAPGFLFSSNTTTNPYSYWEIGVGGGVTFPKDKTEGKYYYTQLYGWFETKPNEQLARDKWIGQVSPAYTFNSPDHLWLLGYVTYSATKHIAIGGHFQSGSVKGLRVELNIPVGSGHIVRIYGVVGNRALVGFSYILQK